MTVKIIKPRQQSLVGERLNLRDFAKRSVAKFPWSDLLDAL